LAHHISGKGGDCYNSGPQSRLPPLLPLTVQRPTRQGLSLDLSVTEHFGRPKQLANSSSLQPMCKYLTSCYGYGPKMGMSHSSISESWQLCMLRTTLPDNQSYLSLRIQKSSSLVCSMVVDIQTHNDFYNTNYSMSDCYYDFQCTFLILYSCIDLDNL
jgi:hypothetical protein